MTLTGWSNLKLRKRAVAVVASVLTLGAALFWSGAPARAAEYLASQTIQLTNATLTVQKADPNAPDIEGTETCDDQGRCAWVSSDGSVRVETYPAGEIK